MSRRALKPIQLPVGVIVAIADGLIKIKGPKGELIQELHPNIQVELDEKNKSLSVLCPVPDKKHRGIHGLYYSLISNMIHGVTKSYTTGLDIIGLGYNVKSQGKNLTLQIGFSHPVNLDIPEGIKVEIINQTNPGKLSISGSDKQLVGQFAANIRKIRPPEPYQGKGIKYVNEQIKI